MTYLSGFLVPVPEHNKHQYIAAARKGWPLFEEYGALSMVENWGTNIPAGKHTDFRQAVDLQEGETVVFSWIVWPDKETSDRCEASMETDDRWKEMMDMPFDGKRMVFGDFETIFHSGKDC